MIRLIVSILLVNIGITSVAQSSNLFDWSAGVIVPNKKYIILGDNNDTPVPSSVKFHTYKTYSVSPINERTTYSVQLIGVRETMRQDGMYDAFCIVNAAGTELLRRFGYGSLCRVRYLTMDEKEQNYFIQIPLDDNSFALIFTGWVYEFDESAGETVIVVVRGSEATIVFDAPALAYSYTAPPNFSMEFVDNVKGLLDDYGNLQVTDVALASRTKYKIWREGNMLKYKMWK